MPLLVFVVGSAVLVRAAIALAGTSDEIAEITGLGRVVIGTLVLAGATSLPEVLTNVSAALADAPDLVVANQLGSNMANMAILAVLDLVHRGRVWPAIEVAHARVAAVAIALTAFAAVAVLTPAGPSVGWIGVDTLAMFLAYIGAVVWFRRNPVVVRVGGLLPATPPPESDREPSDRELSDAVRAFAFAALGLLFAAPVVAVSARELAAQGGVSETVVGTLLLAVATSLPELVTSMAAVRMGAHDLAIGNLFGSNAANMAVLLLADLAYDDGPLLTAVGPEHAVAALGAILLMSLALAVIVTGRDARIGRLEPDAIFLLVVYIGALAAVAVTA